ncbi:MAG: amidase family protein [Steroidobacteraceae bacterium]
MNSRSAHETAVRVQTRETSAEALIQGVLHRIRKMDPLLNCFTTVLDEKAMEDARTIDRRLAAGERLGPLAGVPFGVKDLFDVAGVVTRAGSKILAGNAPARTDAILVQRLKRAGAVLVGCQNMDEFAYGFTIENAHYGATRNRMIPSG